MPKHDGETPTADGAGYDSHPAARQASEEHVGRRLRRKQDPRHFYESSATSDLPPIGGEERRDGEEPSDEP